MRTHVSFSFDHTILIGTTHSAFRLFLHRITTVPQESYSYTHAGHLVRQLEMAPSSQAKY